MPSRALWRSLVKSLFGITVFWFAVFELVTQFIGVDASPGRYARDYLGHTLIALPISTGVFALAFHDLSEDDRPETASFRNYALHLFWLFCLVPAWLVSVVILDVEEWDTLWDWAVGAGSAGADVIGIVLTFALLALGLLFLALYAVAVQLARWWANDASEETAEPPTA